MGPNLWKDLHPARLERSVEFIKKAKRDGFVYIVETSRERKTLFNTQQIRRPSVICFSSDRDPLSMQDVSWVSTHALPPAIGFCLKIRSVG